MKHAITAYEIKDPRESLAMLRVGAVLALHGLAEGDGLIFGFIESCFIFGNDQMIDDAVEGLLWLGLDDAAELVNTARFEYLRSQRYNKKVPKKLEKRWDEITDSYYTILPTERLEAALEPHRKKLIPRVVIRSKKKR